jgi:hypothetical protein
MTDRLLVLNTAIHAADVANPAKPLPVYLQWTERIVAEFFKQGPARACPARCGGAPLILLFCSVVDWAQATRRRSEGCRSRQ